MVVIAIKFGWIEFEIGKNLYLINKYDHEIKEADLSQFFFLNFKAATGSILVYENLERVLLFFPS